MERTGRGSKVKEGGRFPQPVWSLVTYRDLTKPLMGFTPCDRGKEMNRADTYICWVLLRRLSQELLCQVYICKVNQTFRKKLFTADIHRNYS